MCDRPDSAFPASPAAAAAAASAAASSSAAALAALAAASSSISPCSSKIAGRCSWSHATSVYTTGSPRADAACAASCAAIDRRIGGGKFGCRTDNSGASAGYSHPGGKCTSKTHGRHRSSSGAIETVHMLTTADDPASGEDPDPACSAKASSNMAANASASSARSSAATTPPSDDASIARASSSSSSRASTGCSPRSSAYVASSSIHPASSSASLASASENPAA